MNEALETRSVAWVAEETGEHYKNVHRYLRTTAGIPLSFLVPFATATGHRLEWILTGEGDRRPVGASEKEDAFDEIASIVQHTLQSRERQLARPHGEPTVRRISRAGDPTVRRISDAILEIVETAYGERPARSWGNAYQAVSEEWRSFLQDRDPTWELWLEFKRLFDAAFTPEELATRDPDPEERHLVERMGRVRAPSEATRLQDEETGSAPARGTGTTD